MKNLIRIILVSIIVSTLFSSCATICGGSQYYAHVLVASHPDAEIIYQGQTKGHGTASLIVKRNQANLFSVTVRKKGCQEENFNYTSRSLRGWALAGSVFTWGYTGAIVDFADGALWKPNVKEPGIVKSDYKNFQYIVNYRGCRSAKEETEVYEQDKLVDVVYLKNGSIIRGELMESDPTVNVKIKTRDGSIFVFKIEEIEKVTRE